MALFSYFRREPPFIHDQDPQTAVLFCNLGTPDAPTSGALRRYLAEFLSDRRVVEIPRPLWWLILHGIILRLRPRKSAAKYASIWMKEGSPLKVWTEKQSLMLRGWLGQQGHRVVVRYAMRYGNPSIGDALEELKALGITRVLVLPAYPQYSATTTASVIDAVYAWAGKARRIPELRFVNEYHNDAGYIEALAEHISKYWRDNGRAERLVMSFHGIPARNVRLGDPYQRQCMETARLLASRLLLQKDQYQVTFQSRFGKAKWLEPYTEPTLMAMARAGIKRVDVVCPGFTSDCLETLEEIAEEARDAFARAGGREFRYIPCLNDNHLWIGALANIAERHLSGWPTLPPPPPPM